LGPRSPQLSVYTDSNVKKANCRAAFTDCLPQRTAQKPVNIVIFRPLLGQVKVIQDPISSIFVTFNMLHPNYLDKSPHTHTHTHNVLSNKHTRINTRSWTHARAHIPWPASLPVLSLLFSDFFTGNIREKRLVYLFIYLFTHSLTNSSIHSFAPSLSFLNDMSLSQTVERRMVDSI